MKNFERITVDPAQTGSPCVRDLRMPVATVLRLLAGGLTEREILSDYPDLGAEDVRECLRFAAPRRRPGSNSATSENSPNCRPTIRLATYRSLTLVAMKCMGVCSVTRLSVIIVNRMESPSMMPL